MLSSSGQLPPGNMPVLHERTKDDGFHCTEFTFPFWAVTSPAFDMMPFGAFPGLPVTLERFEPHCLTKAVRCSHSFPLRCLIG